MARVGRTYKKFSLIQSFQYYVGTLLYHMSVKSLTTVRNVHPSRGSSGYLTFRSTPRKVRRTKVNTKKFPSLCRKGNVSFKDLSTRCSLLSTIELLLPGLPL